MPASSGCTTRTASPGRSRPSPAGRMPGASYTRCSRPTRRLRRLRACGASVSCTRWSAASRRTRTRTGPGAQAVAHTWLDFFAWADEVLARASARSPLAEALRYAVKLKSALLAYTEDGRLEIDNNLAENALRGIAVAQKLSLRGRGLRRRVRGRHTHAPLHRQVERHRPGSLARRRARPCRARAPGRQA